MTTLMQGLIQLSGHPLVHALGWTLLHFCWQGAAVALVLWCVLGLLGGRSSQARYGAACLALGLTVALPLATFAHVASAEYKARSAMLGPGVVLDAGLVLQVGVDGPAPPWPVRIGMALDRSLPWVLLAWFAGVIVFAGRLNFGLLVARRLKTAGTEAPPPALLRLFEDLRTRLSVARAVALLHSAQVQVPTVIGWLRPVVLLPVSCLTGLSPEQVEAVLCHELAHVRRHDYLVSVIQSVIETILFYHPAVWWVSRQVRRERECCCDELAVAVGGDVLAYARALSLLEESRASFPEFVLGANGGVLKMRIKRILGSKEDTAASPLASIALLAVLVLAASAIAGKLAHAQNGAVQTSSSGSSPALVTVEPDAKQSAVVSAAKGPADGPPPSLSAAGQQTTPDTERQMEDAQRQFQDAQKKLNSAQFKRQMEDAQRQLQDAQKKLNSAQFKKQMEEAQRQFQDFQRELNSAQFKMIAQETGALFAAQSSPASVAAASGAPMHVSAETIQGNLIHKVDPVYPPIAKAAHVQGVVVLHAVISKTGDVEDLRVISGAAMLTSSAMDAVKQWKYRPFLLNGEPTEVESTINMSYTLADAASSQLPTVQVSVGFHSDAKAEQEYKDMVAALRKVGGNVSRPLLIYRVDPEFSVEAHQAKIGGIVLVGMIVSPEGVPVNVHVVRGVGHGLDEQAVAAVKQYRFKPAMEDGKPVPVELNVEINFKIMDSPEPKGAASKPSETPVLDAATPAQSAPQQYDGVPVMKIGGGVTEPMLIYKVDPQFSKEERKAKFEGLVLVNLIVDTKGKPQNVHVVRGVGMGLDEKAVAAVKKYKFKPAMLGGKPVPVGLNVEVNFQTF